MESVVRRKRRRGGEARHRGQGPYELWSIWHYSGDVCERSDFAAATLIIAAEGRVRHQEVTSAMFPDFSSWRKSKLVTSSGCNLFLFQLHLNWTDTYYVPT